MRVLCVTPYPRSSADTRYRIEQFIPGLKAAGIDLTVRPFMSEQLFASYAGGSVLGTTGLRVMASLGKRLLDVVGARRYDAVLLHKEAFMFGPPFLEELLRLQTGKLVYDIDDAFWTHPPQLRQIGRALRDPNRVDKVIAMSDHILAGNAFILDYVRKINTRVSVFPTVIDTDRYIPAVETAGPVTIGWVGRWSSAFYLDRLLEVFQRLCSRHAHLRIRLIGAGQVNLPGVRVESIPWSLGAEIADLHPISIGIMPLDDDQYARYKCGFKLLQYMGLGIASVASPVGVNREIIDHGVNGMFASSQDEWFDALDGLVGDAALRHRLGAAGRETVITDYSLRQAVPRLARTLYALHG